MKKSILISVILITVMVVIGFIYSNNQRNNIPETIVPEAKSSTGESAAQLIAEKTCVKDGESLAPGYYNENSKTWWFDAALKTAPEGCNPACVVSEETKTAEINWRCTGLILPK